jgi:peroxiredoxin
MRLNIRLILIFLIGFTATKVSFANSDTSKAVIFAHANITNDSNAVFYFKSSFSKVPNDSIKLDINGNFMFAVTVKPSDKGYLIGQKDSNTNKISWFVYFILNPTDTVKLDLTKKNLKEIIEFVPNKGISHYRFFNGLEDIKKEFDSISLKLNADISYNSYSAYVNFTFPYINSMIDLDPFVGLELAYIHHQSMFLNYLYSTVYIEGFYKKLDAIVAKDSLFNVNPAFAWYNKQLRLNKKAPPFVLNNLDEQAISLEKYNEKYLLIDIWASWCVPCIEQSKELIKVYPKYKKHNFQILGISTDKSNESWKNAVKKYKFNWEHVWLGTDIKTKNEIESNYRIFSIPITILIAPGGKVLKINPTLKEIEAEIIK